MFSSSMRSSCSRNCRMSSIYFRNVDIKSIQLIAIAYLGFIVLIDF